MIKKLATILFVFMALAFFGANTASAHEVTSTGGSDLRHAYQPKTVTESGWMRARVDNFSSMPTSTLVCVTAYNQANGYGTHLGCLRVNLDPRNGNNWASEFNAPTHWLSPGRYNVVYTYQDNNGNWQKVKSLFLHVQDGNYTAW